MVMALATATTAPAQPSAVKKASKAVFTLNTYNSDGTLLSTSHGVFTGNSGKAVGLWSPFIGAARATVTDASGHTMKVKSLVGVNEIYDICCFMADGKTTPATVSATPAQTEAWLCGPASGKSSYTKLRIESIESFGNGYNYYIMQTGCPDDMTGCPLVNDAGQVTGLLQQSAQTLQFNATDIRLCRDFKLTGFSLNDPVMRKSGIRVELPDSLNQALVALTLSASKDSLTHAGYIEDFIAKFPTASEGYTARAEEHLAARDFADADDDMETAISKCENKDEAHAAYGQLIYQKEVYLPDIPYTGWSLGKALDETAKAISINPLPSYRHQQAQILYAQKKYGEALDIFTSLSRGQLRGGEVFYEMAQCKTMLKAPKEDVLALLDSAVNTQGMNATVAPYLLARGRYLEGMGKEREALRDYCKYDTIMGGRGSDEFYYIKYQCELKLRQYQQALNDIAHAIVLNRNEPTYYAELAALQLRVNQLDDAVKTADLGMRLTQDYADLYIIKGIALCELKKTAEGLPLLEKAKALNDPRADELIEKYKKE